MSEKFEIKLSEEVNRIPAGTVLSVVKGERFVYEKMPNLKIDSEIAIEWVRQGKATYIKPKKRVK